MASLHQTDVALLGSLKRCVGDPGYVPALGLGEVRPRAVVRQQAAMVGQDLARLRPLEPGKEPACRQEGHVPPQLN
jgi:hypothetical protein